MFFCLAAKRAGASTTSEKSGGAVEQQLRAQSHQPTREDLSDMLADHVARQKVSFLL
jgi:hypothetical protein